MNWKEIAGLKYYILYSVALISFFTYSHWVGWKWFNPTKTEHTRSGSTGSHHYRYFYHK